MNKLKRLAAVFVMALTVIYAGAQEAVTNTSGDIMHSNGKIYVVMTVVILIVVGLLLYVISVDRKITKLEKS
jgi:heme/copper-type cytochrome/quinol oxidase subunit 2